MSEAVATQGDGVWAKLHATIASAQGMFFVTLKTLLYSFGVTGITIVFAVLLLALFAGVIDFAGISFSNDLLPAVDYNP